jgi:hypothetical protein
VESCPHCHFLMRDDAHECGVCHRPRVVAAGLDATTAIDSVRVGPGQATGVPVAVVVLVLLVVLFGIGAGLAHLFWT